MSFWSESLSPAQAEILRTRIRNRVVVNEQGCWLWQRAKHPHGYGLMRVGSRANKTRTVIFVHRLAYLLWVEPIPQEYEVSHTCGHNACVNPDHLTSLPHIQVVRNGRAHTQRTHCPQGHAYSPENVYTYPDGRRACRTCRKRAS